MNSYPGCYKNTCVTPPVNLWDDWVLCWGADVLLAVTKDNGDAIDFANFYEHPEPFGTAYPRQFECLYKIIRSHDGGFIACGNDSRNFDDQVVIKFICTVSGLWPKLQKEK